mmetsp:Transcript_76979/g.213972  ORF Transcript_76979/g.213972 Transcript_76979/m.213972 type:complete len:284 (+) Transcript_76979:499-1350(+)
MTVWPLRLSQAVSCPSVAPASTKFLVAAQHMIGCWMSSNVWSLFSEELVGIQVLTDWSLEPETMTPPQELTPKHVTVSAWTWLLATAAPHDDEYNVTTLSWPPMANNSVRSTANAESGIGEMRKFRRMEVIPAPWHVLSSEGLREAGAVHVERWFTRKQPSSPIAYKFTGQLATPVMLPVAASGVTAKASRFCNAAVVRASAHDVGMSPPRRAALSETISVADSAATPPAEMLRTASYHGSDIEGSLRSLTGSQRGIRSRGGWASTKSCWGMRPNSCSCVSRT